MYIALRRDDPEHALYAVKRLHPHLRDDQRARVTLRDESALAGTIEHPNVLRILEAGEDQQGPFLAMEYVEGVSLAELMQAIRRADEEMPIQICLAVARQIAAGLHAIHDQADPQGHPLNLVHRDVSPHNVLVGYDGLARVADFGIAKGEGRQGETSTGVLKGKVGYMSPEQLRFEEPDRRADLFALGVVLWETLTGRRLYHGSDASEGARRILHEPPPDVGDDREDAPPGIVELLFQLLAKAPDDRPRDAAAVVERIDATLSPLIETEGRIDLGSYVASFFEGERADRRRLLDEALARAKKAKDPDAPAPRRSQRWRVKGAAIKSTIEYLLHVHGEAGYARVTELLSDDVRDELSKQVLISNRYDGRVMVELTEAAERLFGSEDYSLAEAIGRASAEYAFGEGGPYEVFRTKGRREGIMAFMSTTGEIYRLYYDVGEMEVVSYSATGASVRISDGGVFPGAIVSRIEAYLRRGFELIGASGVRVIVERNPEDIVLSASWEDELD